MSKDSVNGKWTEIKGNIQNAWGKLTHDDLEATKGNLKSIAGLIRQHYGETKDNIEEKLAAIAKGGEKLAADKSEKAKNDLKSKK